MYRIKLMRKKGTWRTEFAMKSIPPTSLSSQVTPSKLMKRESDHSVALTAIIYIVDSSQLGPQPPFLGGLTGTAIRNLMSIPAQTAMAACL